MVVKMGRSTLLARRPPLLALTALSWLLLACVCGIEYLNRGYGSVLRCQGAALQAAQLGGGGGGLAAGAAALQVPAPQQLKQVQQQPGAAQSLAQQQQQQQQQTEPQQAQAAAAAAAAAAATARQQQQAEQQQQQRIQELEGQLQAERDARQRAMDAQQQAEQRAEEATAAAAQAAQLQQAQAHAAAASTLPSLPHPGTWQEVDALIQQPSPLYGLQQKGGLPDKWGSLLDHMTNRDADKHGLPDKQTPALFDWFARAHTYDRTAAGAGAAVSRLQSPVPACHFWVDHKYRIIYVRNTKTAGTSVAETLGMKNIPMACRINPPACYEKCIDKQVCLEYLWDPEKIKTAFREYLVFTFVRNPWARAISSWKHVNSRGVKRECQQSFAEYARLPSAYGAVCLANPNCCSQRYGWVLEHIEPQAPCLFDCFGKPTVDFIGRVERLDEDMMTLVDLINARRPSNVAPLRQVELPHMVVAGEAEPVDGAAPRAPPTAEQEEARRRSYAELYLSAPAALSHIRSYFAADFERLGFPTSLPPKGDLQQAQMHQAQPAVVAQQQSEQPAGGGALQ